MQKNTPNENASYKYLPLIMLDYVIKVSKKYYHQTLLEECKFEIRKTKMENLINGEFEPSSSDESDNEFDNESSNEFDNESDNESNE